MDGRAFDVVARRWSTGDSRRGVLKAALAAVLTGGAAASLLSAEDAAAKSCKKKCDEKNDKKKRKECKKKCETSPTPTICVPKAPETACSSASECCPTETKYTCGLSHNSGLTNVCCGTHGAACSTTFQCCREPTSFVCSGGQCVPM